jgi:hypothetical protein
MTGGSKRAWAALWVLFAASGASSAPVDTGQGARFYQHDHLIDGGRVDATGIGRLEIDAVRLRQATGLPAGYVNVSTPQGWVVRNLPILAEATYPYAKLATRFALGVSTGTRVQTLDAAVDYSPAPLAAFAGAPVAQGVKPLAVAQAGGGEPTSGPPLPPNLSDISFGNLQGGNDVVVQFDHPNIEAAWNQCVPMSVANSLQFLKDTAGLPVPHAHKAGLRESASAGDDSLVGKIETAMNRPVRDRLDGDYTPFVGGLQGKLRYLAQNGLASRVEVTHWGDLAPNDVSVDAGGTSM